MSDDIYHPQDQGSQPQVHRHACGTLFGCGEEQGTGVFREDIKDAAFTGRAADRLLHEDQLNQEQLDGFLTARGRSRRRLLRASSFMGALAGIGPWFNKLAGATDALDEITGAKSAASKKNKD